MNIDYEAASRRLARYFRLREVPASTIPDLVQDTWVRWVKSPGMIVPDGLAKWVWIDWIRQMTRTPVDLCGEFEDEAGLIQLQPEGPRAYLTGTERATFRAGEYRAARAAAGKCLRHNTRDAAPGKRKCQECLDKDREAARARRAARLEAA